MQQIQSGAGLLSGQILPLPIVTLASCRTHHNGYANINGLTPSTQLAALDLGSNSFHLLIAQENQGRIHVIDKYKEMVRLGEGLVAGGQLSKEVSDRALQCLTRIAQRIRPIAKENLRIVGTNTLRQISSHSTFVFQAEEILGHPIEIISGREEARLIYLGVSHDLGDNASRQLVIDIGGGSTELIVGEQFSPIMLESLHMGCVSMTRKHFSSGLDLALAFEQAINDALIELEPVANSYLTAGWQQVIGASGTVNSVISVQMAMGLGTQISAETLRSIQHQILQRNGTDGLPGLPEERVAVFAGGLAILIAIFATFTPQSVEASQSALREGVLHDLIGRKRDFDIRDQTVSGLCERFAVDQQQASRVKETALALFAQTLNDWEPNPEAQRRLLAWAADLHEIGMDIAHNAYHKHGSYLLSHMDMPGFSRTEQAHLASLVGMHRRKLHPTVLEQNPYWVVKLGVLLRLAAVVHRHRSRASAPVLTVRMIEHRKPATIELKVDEHYLIEHPLTKLDLENEVALLAAIDIQFSLRQR